MIKICDQVLVPPLMIIFKNVLHSGKYPDQWKKANVVPVHKKESKNLLNNYNSILKSATCFKAPASIKKN